MRTLSTLPFAAIDFESAGTAAGKTDEPVQVGVVWMHGGVIAPAFSSYIRPTRPVTWSARAVHGIDDTLLAAAPPLADLWPPLREALRGRWIVAHGAATERRFLRAFPLHDFGPWVDSLALVRRVFPSLPSHALGEAVCALGLENCVELSGPGFRWHDASSDAAASLVLVRHVIEALSLGDHPPEALRDLTDSR